MSTTDVRATPPSPRPPGDAHHEHRRLLVGDLVVRRVTLRSVSRVAWPLFTALYAGALLLGVAAWNIAALAGWSPGERGLSGDEVFWTAMSAGLAVVPLAVVLALAAAALYNTISERTGGVEVAVVSPRRGRRRPVDY